MRPHPRLLVAALTALAALSIAPAASAAPCNDERSELFSDRSFFDLTETGWVLSSRAWDQERDTWNTGGEVFVRVEDAQNFGQYVNPDVDDGCTFEEGGREVVYPDAAADQGIVVGRRTFVPVAGGFARLLVAFTNTASVARTVDLAVIVDHGDLPGSAIDATSTGDTAVTSADHWATQGDRAAGQPPRSADSSFNWQADLPGVPDRADRVQRHTPDDDPGRVPREDTVTPIFDDIVLQPGAKATYLFFLGSHEPRTAMAREAAAAWASEPAELLAGLSAAERATLRNWLPVGDGDRDGRYDDVDNCLGAANADQADLDRDGTGDACDGDVDGDGVDDEVESALGTSNRSGDSDGDGRGDATDACPTVAGLGANGCPRFDTPPATATPLGAPSPPAPQLGLRVAPRSASARLENARDTRAPYRFRLLGAVVPPPGISAREACATSAGFVAVQVKRGSTTLSTRRVALRPDCGFSSTVTFANARRFGKARSLRFTARFLGNAILTPVEMRPVTGRIR